MMQAGLIKRCQSGDKKMLEDGRHTPFEFGLFLVSVSLVFIIRIRNVHYNTLFLDEAINAIVGEDLLAGVFDRRATAFHFGSYLYPAVSAVIEQIGGASGLRIGSAVMSTVTAVFIYLSTRALLSKRVALVAIIWFGFTGIAINLGQLAVYDSLSILFLSLALFALILATQHPEHERKYLFTASISAVLMSLSKYIGLIYLPALILTTFALFTLQGRAVREVLPRLFLFFVLPAVLLLGAYGIIYFADLQIVFSQQGFSYAPRHEIRQMILEDIGAVIWVALFGLLLLFKKIWQKNPELPVAFKPLLRRNDHAIKSSTFKTLMLLVVILFLLWLAAPVYHLLASNGRSLWKNNVYSLIFLLPLASWIVIIALDFARSQGHLTQILGFVLALIIVTAFIRKGLDDNWLFQMSWPNESNAIEYLRNTELDSSSRALVESMDIYEYYFDFGTQDRDIWHNVWFLEYGGLNGREAMQSAIRDHYFDYVVIENYYAPDIREQLEPTLVEAGYKIGFQEAQLLRAGHTILIQVYIMNE